MSQVSLLPARRHRRAAGAAAGLARAGAAIVKEFTFAGFPEAVAFVSRLVAPSEAADHHPDLAIHYRRVTRELHHAQRRRAHREGLRRRAAWPKRWRGEAEEALHARARSRRQTGLTGAAAAVVGPPRPRSRRRCPSHRTEAGGYTERRYTPIELLELMVLADLRRRGFSLGRIRRLLTVLRTRFKVRLFEAIEGGGPVTLFIDGDDIYARTEAGRVLQRARQPAAAAAGARPGAAPSAGDRPRAPRRAEGQAPAAGPRRAAAAAFVTADASPAPPPFGEWALVALAVGAVDHRSHLAARHQRLAGAGAPGSAVLELAPVPMGAQPVRSTARRVVRRQHLRAGPRRAALLGRDSAAGGAGGAVPVAGRAGAGGLRDAGLAVVPRRRPGDVRLCARADRQPVRRVRRRGDLHGGAQPHRARDAPRAAVDRWLPLVVLGTVRLLGGQAGGAWLAGASLAAQFLCASTTACS